MNKPMIENNDRGITLNKSLAWSIVVVLFGAVVSAAGSSYFVGQRVQEVYSDVGTLKNRQSEDRADIRQNTAQINAIRNQNARVDQRLSGVDQRLSGIEQSASRTESSVQEILRYLRNENRGAP